MSPWKILESFLLEKFDEINPIERDEALRTAKEELPDSFEMARSQLGIDLNQADEIGFNDWGDLLVRVKGQLYTWDVMDSRWNRTKR